MIMSSSLTERNHMGYSYFRGTRRERILLGVATGAGYLRRAINGRGLYHLHRAAEAAKAPCGRRVGGA
jgi:hypothetical protein